MTARSTALRISRIHGDEWSSGQVAFLVNRPGGNAFAGAALAENKNRSRSRRRAQQHVRDLAHARGGKVKCF
jgi:hypothetical protein